MKYRTLFFFLATAILLAACAPAASNSNQPTPIQKTQSESATQTDSQGAVTFEVTPLNLNNPGDTLQFDVTMSTHSVELSMDLATLATLTTDTGATIQAILWDGPTGGHHVEGKLSFPASQNGKSVLAGAKQLTLTITNVDAPERTFVWELSAK